MVQDTVTINSDRKRIDMSEDVLMLEPDRSPFLVIAKNGFTFKKS